MFPLDSRLRTLAVHPSHEPSVLPSVSKPPENQPRRASRSRAVDPGLTLVGTAGHRAVTVFAFLPVLSADFVAFDDPENFLKSIAPFNGPLYERPSWLKRVGRQTLSRTIATRFGHAQPMPMRTTTSATRSHRFVT
jgi:hypothetical protein